MKNIYFLAIVCLSLFAACGDHKEEKKEVPEKKKDTAVAEEKKPEAETQRAPIINIMDTLSLKYLVMSMKDSAANAARINLKLAEILGFKLANVIKKNGQKVTGKPIAWYTSTKAPYFFEAGLPVDKKPAKQPSNVYVREIGIDSVVVAHFYGPYELLPQAYEALTDWMKSHKKTIKGKPYEIYVDDPMDKDGKLKDPYKVQTDVVFPWK